MLTLLYEREAKARAVAADGGERRRIDERGIPWQPKSMLTADAAYTKTRAEEISRNLKKLEERGLVLTFGSEPHRRRRTRFVRLTDLGRHEARQIAQREGMSETGFEEELGLDELRRGLARALRRRNRARRHASTASGDAAAEARGKATEEERACEMWRALIRSRLDAWSESEADRTRAMRALTDELRRMGHLP